MNELYNKNKKKKINKINRGSDCFITKPQTVLLNAFQLIVVQFGKERFDFKTKKKKKSYEIKTAKSSKTFLNSIFIIILKFNST